MRFLCFLAVILFFPVTLLAGEADLLANELQRTYQKAHDWKADFVQTTYVELLDKTIEKQGSLAIKKPGMIRIEYQDDDGKLYVSEGKKLWVYAKGDSQVVLYRNFGKILASEALSFLQGLGNIRQQFRVGNVTQGQVTETMMQNPDLALLGLEPVNPDSVLSNIILGIDTQSGLVKEATLFNASGNKTHYLFRNIQLNSSLSEALFRFVAPKGVKEVKG